MSDTVVGGSPGVSPSASVQVTTPSAKVPPSLADTKAKRLSSIASVMTTGFTATG